MQKFIFVLCCMVVFSCNSAVAALGGNITTIEEDRIQLQALEANQAISSGAYSVHEMTTNIGTHIREYTNGNGVIFAVTWSGPAKPDLHQLLGQYFEPFIAAASTRPQRLSSGPVTVRQNDFVVHSGGHARAFVGHAYVPSLIPDGVSINALL